MIKELEGLTLDVIDALLESVSQRSGLLNGIDSFHTSEGCCTLGSLGYNQQGVYSDTLRWRRMCELNFRSGVDVDIFQISTQYGSTKCERKTYMLNWLRKQRALKCSGWTPHPIERVPARRPNRVALV